MSLRWRVILPAIGLLLFVGETYQSVRINRGAQHQSAPYFWWSSIRLDSDPLNKHPEDSTPCKADEENCVTWGLRGIWADPGLLTMLLMFSGFPVFAIGKTIVLGLGHFGINEIWSFMIVIPTLLFAWYYFIGFLVDRRISRQRKRV
jgi:hypothetical protein